MKEAESVLMMGLFQINNASTRSSVQESLCTNFVVLEPIICHLVEEYVLIFVIYQYCSQSAFVHEVVERKRERENKRERDRK